jgi:BTB/POZ domain
MLNILRTLYNGGENNGNVVLRTLDKDLKVHSFVLEWTSEFFRNHIRNESFSGIIDLNINFDLVQIVLIFLYSERITDKELSGYDIIKLFDLIDTLKCGDLILVLKNHYLQKFPKTLNENNWKELLIIVFNQFKYHDLQIEILRFFKNHILLNLDKQFIPHLCENIHQNEQDQRIKELLFSISLEKLCEYNECLKNDLDHGNKTYLNAYIKNINDDSDEHISDEEEEEKEVKKLNKKIVKKK